MKKTSIIIIAIVLLAALYFLFSSKPEMETENPVVENDSEIINEEMPIFEAEAGLIEGELAPEVSEVISEESEMVSEEGEVFCTMDTMQCPDGSFVGRVAPGCEFAACPIPAENAVTPELAPELFIE